MQEIGPTLGEQPDVEAEVRHTLGVTYRGLGAYPEAVALLERALAIRAKILGADAVDTIDTRNELVLSMLWVGRFEYAAELAAAALETSVTAQGERHPLTLTARYNLARVHIALGLWGEAKVALESGSGRLKRP